MLDFKYLLIIEVYSYFAIPFTSKIFGFFQGTEIYR